MDVGLLRTGLAIEIIGASALAFDVLGARTRGHIEARITDRSLWVLFAGILAVFTPWLYAVGEGRFGDLLLITDDWLHGRSAVLRTLDQFQLSYPATIRNRVIWTLDVGILLTPFILYNYSRLVGCLSYLEDALPAVQSTAFQRRLVGNKRSFFWFWIVLLVARLIVEPISTVIAWFLMYFEIASFIVIGGLPLILSYRWRRKPAIESWIRFGGFILLIEGFIFQLVSTG